VSRQRLLGQTRFRHGEADVAHLRNDLVAPIAFMFIPA
jgi:hypothetical protein